MNGRSGKILISILCGAMLLIAGCTTPAPSGEAGPTPVERTAQVSQVTDLGAVTSLLQTMNDRLALIAENTRPEGRGTVTGNIVLFDTSENAGNPILSGTSIEALPPGKCDVAVYAQMKELYVTLEEEKNMDVGREREYRNRQTCIDDPLCRRTVQLDDEYAFLYIEYKPYKTGDTLSQVTLSYRCKPL
jgi:hypothetical protein